MNGKLINNVKTVMLLSAMTGLILAGGYALGGRVGVIIALVIAAVTNLTSYFFSDKIAIASMHAKEVGPEHELHDIVARLVQRSNMPMPKVYVAPHDAPNAFATGRNPRSAAVCATEGLLRTLSRNEVAGVMAHELAHVMHRDILITTIAATIGGAINFLGYMMMFGGIGRRSDNEGGHPIVGLLLMILGPIAAGIIQMAISRQREYAADTEGGRLCGDPMHLATALDKIHTLANRIPMEVNPAFNALMIAEPKSFGSTMANLFSTHPTLEDRLTNLIGRPQI